MEIWEKYFKDLQTSYQKEYTFKAILKLQSNINYSKVLISGRFLQHNSRNVKCLGDNTILTNIVASIITEKYGKKSIRRYQYIKNYRRINCTLKISKRT